MTPSTSPYLHTAPPLRRVMLQVAAALIPGILVLIWWQGSRWLGQLAVAVITAYLCETAVLLLRQRPLAPLRDGSVLITALLLALSLPVLAPWWLVALGTAFAVLLGKHLYGGLGQNPFNPAMVGFAILLVSFPALMSGAPAAPVALGSVDATSAATLLDHSRMLRIGGAPLNALYPPWQQQLLTAAWLAGGIWLTTTRAADYRLLASTLIGATLCATAFWLQGTDMLNPYAQLTSGAIIFGACFIATDPVTAATTPLGRWIYGIYVGAVAIAIRNLGNFPDGVAFAILLGNGLVPLIDPLTQPRYR
ncbi:RnfABCDGE type electron transport complex subunit D [uncultured Cardiobacterium sp.]|uniref:RnfABCDGE type electron transport complex subunit D n=1 Tax=uncultured Cardiobacterium sp. TaxID=417619 RepID=UPI002605A6F7|nr:RnfABCDGE type electron transport complex subunit D [uncultured Cardiobacterium sp.]